MELEVDSELVMGFLLPGISDAHPLAFLVWLCHGSFSRNWLVRITHVYREGNRLADGLANLLKNLICNMNQFNLSIGGRVQYMRIVCRLLCL